MTTAPWKISLICASALALILPTYVYAQTGGTSGTGTTSAATTSASSPTSTTVKSPSSTSPASPTATSTTATNPAATSTTPASTTPASTTTVTSTAPSPGEGTDTAEGEGESRTADESAPIDGETYRVRLRDLEQRVDELKEQIRRSHTRLSLLSDTILSGASGGARAEIEFVNDLSGAWHLVEAVFVLDGAVQYKKADDTGVLAKQKVIPIFSGSIPTGDHTLQVLLKLRGHGFGVFSYLRGMEANLTSNHSFTVTGGKVIELNVTAWEKGGPTTPVEQQPDVRFGQRIRSASDTPNAAPARSSASPGGSGNLKTENTSDRGKVGAGLSAGGGTTK